MINCTTSLTPVETELLVQADRLVGGRDAVLVIDDTAIPKKGAHSVGRCAICFGAGQDCQLPDPGIADACSGRAGVAAVSSRELDEQADPVGASGCSSRISNGPNETGDGCGGDRSCHRGRCALWLHLSGCRLWAERAVPPGADSSQTCLGSRYPAAPQGVPCRCANDLAGARFAAVRVRVADGPPQRIRDKGQQHLPGDEAWLIGEHRMSGEKKYYLANLPAKTDLRTLAATIKARWICEQAHQQMKEELGLDHFEGRSWQGLHRHALMTMIAYAFLQHRRLAATARKKKINGPPPQPTLPAVRHAIIELFARLPPQRCPHCRKWICSEQRRE